MTRTAALTAASMGLLLSAAVPMAFAHSASGHRAAPLAPGQNAHTSARPLDQTLATLGKRAGVRIGTAVNTDALADEPAYTRQVATQFSSVTPENVMKWDAVEPSRGSYNWKAADQLVSFARAHGQLVRGHTLVWHSQLPSWLTNGSFTPAQLRDILRKHITDEAGHFKGKIWQWDVVNEAFNDDGTLRDTIWLQQLGPGYIADAFRWAHQADPKAVLFINDYNIEGVNAKSTALYNLVKKLRGQGVPIHGVGVQGHLDVQYPAPHDIAQNLARFDALGVQTAITEADVRIPLPSDNTKVEAQNQAYSTLLQGCLLTARCTDFTVWGFTDKYSWVPSVFTGEGDANIMDADYQPKSAFTVLQQNLLLAGRHR
ncbi:endo-1,4-beta-xylanase [Peterkaempfera bronchialis]|uniref:endo-1,4-beta-xylanase n=1 Tax=Peterkaempfera bronchialis TaxID=2126346 RepID=UPI003C2D8FFD